MNFGSHAWPPPTAQASWSWSYPVSVCPGPLYSVYSQRRTHPLVRDRVRRAMFAKRYSVEQIVAKLREAEKLLAQGATSPSVSSMDSRST